MCQSPVAALNDLDVSAYGCGPSAHATFATEKLHIKTSNVHSNIFFMI